MLIGVGIETLAAVHGVLYIHVSIYIYIYTHTYSPTALYRFLASGILNILKPSKAVWALFFDIAVWGE